MELVDSFFIDGVKIERVYSITEKYDINYSLKEKVIKRAIKNLHKNIKKGIEIGVSQPTIEEKQEYIDAEKLMVIATPHNKSTVMVEVCDIKETSFYQPKE